MFPHDYFAAAAFAPEYFPPVVTEAIAEPVRPTVGVRLPYLGALYDDDDVLLLMIGRYGPIVQ
jgi:hypothetical protein